VGSRDGVVEIALVSHLRDPGSGHEWVKLVVDSILSSERFFSGFSGFPISSKINISKFQFDQMQDLPENYFRVSGASWVNINNYSPRRSLAGFWRAVSRMKRETNDSKVNHLLSFDINILSN